MIRPVAPSEANQVFNLMSKVYSSHSFLNGGIDSYQTQVANEKYVSLGDFDEDGVLRAHAGYKIHPDFALINALVVDPDRRSAGLGRSIFEVRLEHIRNSKAFDFIVGYSVMQHLGSQRLYADMFKPIGVDIGYQDIYHQSDAKYNRGNESNAEMALCQRISSRDYPVDVVLHPRDQILAQRVFDSLGITCNFGDSPPEGAKQVFLGFHPNAGQGLFTPAYIRRAASVNFGPLLTSNPERRAFVDSIKEDYERSSVS